MSYEVIKNKTCEPTGLHPLDRRQGSSQQTAAYCTALSSLQMALTPVEKQQSADLHQTVSSLLLREMLHTDFSAS